MRGRGFLSRGYEPTGFFGRRLRDEQFRPGDRGAMQFLAGAKRAPELGSGAHHPAR
jgi:hypothetical protein